MSIYTFLDKVKNRRNYSSMILVLTGSLGSGSLDLLKLITSYIYPEELCYTGDLPKELLIQITNDNEKIDQLFDRSDFGFRMQKCERHHKIWTTLSKIPGLRKPFKSCRINTTGCGHFFCQKYFGGANRHGF